MFAQDKSFGQRSTAPFQIDDQVLIEMAKHAENGNKFRRLWAGDFRDYPSQSEADLALCRMLAFWTNHNQGIIDRLFRQSGLYRRKWDQPHFASGQTYGQATIERALSTSGDTYRQNSKSTNSETTQREFHLTDLGNAERLVFHFGDQIRYCHAWNTWIIWDVIRWVPDHTDKIRQLAKKVIRRIYSEAEQVNDPNKRQSIAKHAMNSESEKRIRSMISLAQSEVPITPDELDQNKLARSRGRATATYWKSIKRGLKTQVFRS
jgi:putative DNA primase/helicase